MCDVFVYRKVSYKIKKYFILRAKNLVSNNVKKNKEPYWQSKNSQNSDTLDSGRYEIGGH